jgi:hypothetical protein
MIGRVYGIVDKRKPDIILYVGSTEQTLKVRWALHKYDSKHRKSKVNVYLREHGGIDNFEMKLLDEGKFDKLKAHEEHYRLLLDPPLNMRKCSVGDITMQEYMQQYYDANRGVIRARSKQRYEANRDTIRAKAATKIECECGAAVSRNNIAEHRKTEKHKTRMLKASARKDVKMLPSFQSLSMWVNPGKIVIDPAKLEPVTFVTKIKKFIPPIGHTVASHTVKVLRMK